MMEAEDDIVFEEPPLEVLVLGKQSIPRVRYPEFHQLSDDAIVRQGEQAVLVADHQMSLLAVASRQSPHQLATGGGVGGALLAVTGALRGRSTDNTHALTNDRHHQHHRPLPQKLSQHEAERNNRRRLDTDSTEGDAISSDGEDSIGHVSDTGEATTPFPWRIHERLFGGAKEPYGSVNPNPKKEGPVDAAKTRNDGEEKDEEEDEEEVEDRSTNSDNSDVPVLLLADREITIEEESNNNAFLTWVSQRLHSLQQQEYEESKDDEDAEASDSKNELHEQHKTITDGEIQGAGGFWKWWIAQRANQDQESEEKTPTEPTKRHGQLDENDAKEKEVEGAHCLQKQRSSDSGDVTFLHLFVNDDHCTSKENDGDAHADADDGNDDNWSLGSEEIDFMPQDTVVYRPHCFIEDGYKAWDGAGEFNKT